MCDQMEDVPLDPAEAMQRKNHARQHCHAQRMGDLSVHVYRSWRMPPAYLDIPAIVAQLSATYRYVLAAPQRAQKYVANCRNSSDARAAG